MMRALKAWLLAGVLTASAVQAAQDHSAHQRASPTPESDAESQHSEHQPHSPQGAQQVPAQSSTDHAGHTQEPAPSESSQGNPHGHHMQPDADIPTESEKAHVPPPPPERPLHDMSEERMIELMQMEDNAAFGTLLVDQLEWREINGSDAQFWELQGWYGTDYNKIWLETEGDRVDGEVEGRAELLWDRIVSPWWSLQSGVRQDFSEGPSRTWGSVGVQGLAPYFFELDAAFYIGEQGRTAARFSGEYDVLLTQRLILQPEVEFELYGKGDPENGIGSGVSDVEFGLRLRYEIRRELAPYVGVHWERVFGNTADLARASGEDTDDLLFVAGLRAWF